MTGERFAVTTVRADAGTAHRPPLILVHGAANSAGVWRFWQEELARLGWHSHALDLRGHGRAAPTDLAHARMADYAADVCVLASQLGQPPVLVGWSMGGLVALMAAAEAGAVAWVGLAPSTPAEQEDERVPLRTGVFGPEEYGIVERDPDRQAAMPDLDWEERAVALASLGPESRLARDERQRGIVVGRLPCPLLLVAGTLDQQWPAERYSDFRLPAERLSVEGASHWGLVLNRRVLPGLVTGVVGWIAGAISAGGPAEPPRTAGRA